MLKIYTVFFFIYSQNFQSTLIKTLRLHRAGVWGGQARGQTIQRVVIYAVNVDVCSTALLTTKTSIIKLTDTVDVSRGSSQTGCLTLSILTLRARESISERSSLRLPAIFLAHATVV